MSRNISREVHRPCPPLLRLDLCLPELAPSSLLLRSNIAADAGRKATDECLIRLGSQVWVTATVLPDDQQPDQLSTQDFEKLLAPLFQ